MTVVNMLIRCQARADKNFKLSDQIRDQLIAYGMLKDGKKELPLVFKIFFLVISQTQLLII
jgi:cysteinyl-tRNA synthetase